MGWKLKLIFLTVLLLVGFILFMNILPSKSIEVIDLPAKTLPSILIP